MQINHSIKIILIFCLATLFSCNKTVIKYQDDLSDETVSEPTTNKVEFEEPFRITVNGKLIETVIGHSAPKIYDFNEDGKMDLLVGEFGNVPIPKGEDPYLKSDSFVQGRCKVYINKGSNEEPEYEEGFYLQAGGKPAYVPTTCCISFYPTFVDLDGDHIDDIISGSYPGIYYFFKGLGKGEFAKPEIMLNEAGDVIYMGYSSVIDAADADEDGDLDLLLSYRGGGATWVENIGSQSKPVYSKTLEKVGINKVTNAYGYPNFPNAAFYRDWDGDGLEDIVAGWEESMVAYYKNTGKTKENRPVFAEAQILQRLDIKGEEKKFGFGGRPKLDVYDYNQDGKPDLIVGGVISGDKSKKVELSPELEAEKKSLTSTQKELKEKIKTLKAKTNAEYKAKLKEIRERQTANPEAYIPEYDLQLKAKKESLARLSPETRNLIKEYQNTIDQIDIELKEKGLKNSSTSTGYVWVYLSK